MDDAALKRDGDHFGAATHSASRFRSDFAVVRRRGPGARRKVSCTLTADEKALLDDIPSLSGGVVETATRGAALAIGARLLALANRDASSPLRGLGDEDVEMLDGRLRSKSDTSRSVAIADVMRRNNLREITESFDARPGPERENYATLAHGAQFVEVKVDLDVGTVRVTRAIEITACGRIMNPNLQHYHVPVNADVHMIETEFVEEEDTIVNPLGVKGMGVLGMVGIPAAIANAVFHATGRRIRDLPITPEKLL